MNINYDKIAIELNDDLLFITVSKYKLFLANKEDGGLDAMTLYLHYIFVNKLPYSNIITTNNTQVKNDLGWGDIKFKRAKAFLKKHGFIDYDQIRNSDGTMSSFYIIIKE